MYDAVLQFATIARQHSTILQDLGLEQKGYLLATVHRPYNTDVAEHLRSILTAFLEIEEPVIFPVHPRTRQKIDEIYGTLNLSCLGSGLKLIEPMGYLEMFVLEENALLIMIYSGEFE